MFCKRNVFQIKKKNILAEMIFIAINKKLNQKDDDFLEMFCIFFTFITAL